MKSSEMFHAMGRMASFLENEIAEQSEYFKITQRKPEELGCDFVEFGLLLKLLETVENFDSLDCQKAYETGEAVYKLKKSE